MLTEETVRMTVRAAEQGRVHRIAPAGFRRLMAQDPELSDLLLRTFIARREMQHSYGPAGEGIEIIGEGPSASSLALRTYAARQNIPHRWVDADDVTGTALMSAVALNFDDLPAVVALGRVLRRATPEDLADYLGLTYRPRRPATSRTSSSSEPDRPVWPAPCTAPPKDSATILLDASAPGGQAAASRQDRELPGLSHRSQRRGIGPACGGAGAEVRGPALEPLRDRRAGVRRRPVPSAAVLSRRDATSPRGR